MPGYSNIIQSIGTRFPLSKVGILNLFLLSLLAVPTINSLIHQWEINPDYALGWFLLPFTIYLVVRARPWLTAVKPNLGYGLSLVTFGGLIHLFTMVIPWLLFDYVGWFFMFLGMSISLWGSRAANRIAPILCFGVLMFPLPAPLLNTSAMLLQDLVAILTEWAINCFSVCLRRGHLLYLAGLDEPVSVAVECSGIRQVLVFVSIAWGMSFFLRGSPFRKVLLILSALPMAILANMVRVLALTMIARFYGTASIKGMLHDLPMLITLPIGGVMLWQLFHVLQTSHVPENTLSLRQEPSHPKKHGFLVILLSFLLLCQWAIQYHLLQVPKPTGKSISFATLPTHLGSWTAHPHPEIDKVKQKSEFADDLLLRAYVNDLGQAAAVYLVYSATGQDRQHHPEICLRDAGGAMEIKRDRMQIPIQSNTGLYAERFRYVRNRQTTTVYYWHYTIMPTELNTLTALQRVHLRQQEGWPSVTVQVQTNMDDPHALRMIEISLLPTLHAILQELLPDKTISGSARLSIRFLQ